MELKERTGLGLKSWDRVRVEVVLDVYSATKNPIHLLPRFA